MTIKISSGKGTHKLKPDSWTKLMASIDQASTAIFRQPRSFTLADGYHSKRTCQYWWERLVDAGLMERKVQKRGWFVWKMYRLVLSPENTRKELGDIPF